jgi:hypothetical protein
VQDWTYELVGVETIEGVSVAVVEGVGRLKLEPDLSSLPAQGPRPTIRLTDGSASNRVLFDLSRGEAVGRDSRLQTNVSIDMALPDGRRLSQRVDETIRGQVWRVEE